MKKFANPFLNSGESKKEDDFLNSQSKNYNYDTWFEDKNSSNGLKKINNDWNIDYKLETKEEENPFAKKQYPNKVVENNQSQYLKNRDFFMHSRNEEYNEPRELEDENRTYLCENEIDDNKLLLKVNKYAFDKVNEIPVPEEKNNKEKINFNSNENLNFANNGIDTKHDYSETKEIGHQPLVSNQEANNVVFDTNNLFFETKEQNQNNFYAEQHDKNLINQNLINEKTDANQIEDASLHQKKERDNQFVVKCMPLFNFNFGWTYLKIENSKNYLFSQESKESNIKIAIKDFPGPIKLEKNASYITNTYNKLFEYMNAILNIVPNTSYVSISKKFSWTLLNEILLNKKISFYELISSSSKFQDSLLNYIETFFFPFYEPNINLEEFKNEVDCLLNLLNLNQQQYADLIEDNQWETIFFAKLFLVNQKTQEMAKDVKDILINYIERTYKKGYPIYTFTLLKLGKYEKFYENSQLFTDFPMLYLWFLLKIVGNFDEKMWKSLLETLFYQLNDVKKDSFLQFSFLLLCMGFENENMNLLLQQNNSTQMIQMFETFFFLVNSLTNFQYDTSKFLYKNLFPTFIKHAYNLSENDFHEKAIEYVNLIESSKNIFFHLEKNWYFMNSLREIKQRLIANIGNFYSPKDKKLLCINLETEKSPRHINKTSSSNDFREEMNKNNNEKDFSHFKKNFYSYMNSALDIIKNPISEMKKNIKSNEKPSIEKNSKNNDFYYDNDLKTWILNGVPASSQNEEQEEKSEIKEKEVAPVEEKKYIPPPMITKSIQFFLFIIYLIYQKLSSRKRREDPKK